MNKPLRRKTQDRALIETDKRTERCPVAGIEAGKGLPFIALIRRLEALGKVNLITITALQIRLHACEFFRIGLRGHV